MTTALDSCILFDILSGTAARAASSRRAMLIADEQGNLIMSAVTFAEVAGSFGSRQQLRQFLDRLPVTVTVLDEETAFLAGQFTRNIGNGAVRALAFSATS